MGRRVAGAVLGVAAAFLLTGASQGPSVTLYPSTPSPGQQVWVYAVGCADGKSTTQGDIFARSPGFVDEAKLSSYPNTTTWRGSATVKRSARGPYRVVVTGCDTGTATGSFRVGGGGHPTTGPNTGGGWLALQASADGGARWPWLAGAVAVLVGGAGAGLAVALRRRRSERDGVDH
ncbi:hypothetical protein ACIBG8_24910 [Nonomuraea sp. NPDC050556]|uniref:hypothetical protein n=1 Tax=Nonomuraea sp. NPDC050556 TaxID=3364369 RepID=UPI00379D1055